MQNIKSLISKLECRNIQIVSKIFPFIYSQITTALLIYVIQTRL